MSTPHPHHPPYTYHPLVAEVLRTITRHDPLRLVALGCPDDEYDLEAYDIARRLPNATSPAAMTHLAWRTFVRWFGQPLAGSERAYRALGRDLWALKTAQDG